MKYGIDVASVRLDDLDKRLLAEVRGFLSLKAKVTVLDAGCGVGGLAVAMARAGASVIAVDIGDFEKEITEALSLANVPRKNISFVQADLQKFIAKTESKFDFIVLQRSLHYLPYVETRQVLEKALSLTQCLYFSVTGTNTEIAHYYRDIAQPIESRWAKLDDKGQDLFSISAPLCLYSEAEVRNLLKETGWQVNWLRVSDFGNIKVEAVPM